MAGFCSRCGRPLPEDGKCPFCAPQQAQPEVGYVPQETKNPAPKPDAPSGFSVMMKNYVKFITSFMKAPVDTLRQVEEDRDMTPALVNAAAIILLAFFGALITALRFRPEYGSFAWLGWLGTAFAQPVVGFGTAVGAVFLTLLVGKERVNFRSVLSSVGASATLPVAALATLFVFQLLGLWFYTRLWSLLLVTCAVCLVVLLTKVYKVKLNFWQLLVIIGVMFVGYSLLTGIESWFRAMIITNIDLWGLIPR